MTTILLVRLPSSINGGRQDSTSVKRIAKIILDQDADYVFVIEDYQNIVCKLQNEITEKYPYTSNTFRGGAHYLYSKASIETSEKLGTDT